MQDQMISHEQEKEKLECINEIRPCIESFHLFPCIFTRCQKIVDNFPNYPKIKYPCQLKGKGIR